MAGYGFSTCAERKVLATVQKHILVSAEHHTPVQIARYKAAYKPQVNEAERDPGPPKRERAANPAANAAVPKPAKVVET